METTTKKPAGYLQESDGTKSSTRLKSFLTLIFSFIFLMTLVIKSVDLNLYVIGMMLILLVAAFVPQHLKSIADIKFTNLPGMNKKV